MKPAYGTMRPAMDVFRIHVITFSGVRRGNTSYVDSLYRYQSGESLKIAALFGQRYLKKETATKLMEFIATSNARMEASLDAGVLSDSLE